MGGPIIAYAAARRRRQRLEQQEETMNPYTPPDLAGWELVNKFNDTPSVSSARWTPGGGTRPYQNRLTPTGP